MKRILVVSDSHGKIRNFEEAVENESPDMIIFLGDGIHEAKKIRRKFPKIPLLPVRGNCDYDYDIPVEDILEIEGHRILFTHGNMYNVKLEYRTIEACAKEKGADAVLFGHTHKMYYTYHNGLMLLNPGSIGNPPYGIPASCAVITVARGEQIKIDTRFFD